jgi:hypothetical protein
MILHFVDISPTLRRHGMRRNSLPLHISVHTGAKETLAYRWNGKQSLPGRTVV